MARIGAVAAQLAAQLAASSWPLVAETPPEFSASVEVRLVEVDAWAADGGGPVLDLAADELRLWEDGERVDILFFTPPARPAASGESAASRPTGPPSWRGGAEERPAIAVFLDEAHLAPPHRERAVGELADWFTRGFGQPIDATVVRFGHRLDVVVPRTSDAARVAEALRTTSASGQRAVELSVGERQTLDEIRRLQRRGLEDLTRAEDLTRNESAGDAGGRAEGGGTAETAAVSLPCSMEMLQTAERWAEVVERSGRESLEALRGYVASLAALPGRKFLLYVSDGIPSRPGGAAYDLVRTLCDGTGAAQGLQDAIDVTALAGELRRPGQLDRASIAFAGESRQLANRFEEVIAQAGATGVTVWTLGTRGATLDGADASQAMRERSPGDTVRQRAERDDLLAALAADTGGRAVLETGDLGPALDDLILDLTSGYLLAFSAPRVSDGKLHRIRLDTTRRGVRLRYRQSWRDTSGGEELVDLVAGSLLHGVDRPGLGASAAIGRAPAGPKAGRTMLRVVIPESALSLLPEADGSRHGVLRIALALQSPGADPTTVRSRSFPIDLPPFGGAGSAKSVVRDIELPEIPAGTVVAVGLRDEVDGETGILRLELAAPGDS